MPEVINRLVTDSISTVFITTSVDTDENLVREGVAVIKIHMLGKLMTDNLVVQLGKTQKTNLNIKLLNRDVNNGVDFLVGQYGVLTFHRSSNVDYKASLTQLVHL